MIKVGVIGTGSMGQHHARIYHEMDNVSLVGISDIDKERAMKIAKRYYTKAYTNYKDLLSQGLDAVSIAVPTAYHKMVSIDAIKHGVNVLVEKPIADTVDNAEQIINAAHDNGMILMVGHVERFNPVIKTAKRLIDEGYIGDVLSISTTRIGPYPERLNDIGVILDLAIHDIDLIRYLTDKEIVKINCEKHYMENGFDDEAFILLWSGDVMSSVNVSWRSLKKVRKMRINGKKGVINIDYINQDLELYRDSSQKHNISSFANMLFDYSTGMVEMPIINKTEPLKDELAHFVDCVINKNEPCINGYDAMNTLGVIERLIKMK